MMIIIFIYNISITAIYNIIMFIHY